MRASRRDIVNAKKRIELLMGREVFLKVNEGRNRIVSYSGRVEEMYNAIFAVRDVASGKLYTYPYADLITKNVKFLQGK